MKISPKQDKIAATIAAGARVILLEGAIGTSKTYGAAVALNTIAVDYPGSRIYVGRRHMPELKKGTLLSFREAAFDMGLVEGYHYNENRSENFFEFATQGQPTSYIFFVELDHIKDPQFFKLKSVNATCAYIDEADGVIEDAFLMLHSRTGRANKNGAPAFTMLSCNANDAWPKQRFYNQFKHPDKYGRLPADTKVIEFNITDSFLGQQYYDQFAGNPPQWRQRYLYNNWDYGDDLYSLFKYKHLDSLHVTTFERGLRCAGNDVARTGRDRSVIAMFDGKTLVDIQITKDSHEQIDTADQAVMAHDYALAGNIGYQNYAVDGVGLGVGVIDGLKSKYGWVVPAFIAGSKPMQKLEQERLKADDRPFDDAPITYNNLRTEMAWLLSQEVEAGTINFWDGCPYLNEFKKEATMHNYEIKDKVLVLEAKDRVKQRTGHSPDIFDSVLMAYWRVLASAQVGSYGRRPSSPAAPSDRPGSGGKPITAGLRRKEF